MITSLDEPDRNTLILKEAIRKDAKALYLLWVVLSTLRGLGSAFERLTLKKKKSAATGKALIWIFPQNYLAARS